MNIGTAGLGLIASLYCGLTAAQTPHLVKDFNTTTSGALDSASSDPASFFTASNGTVYFAARTLTAGGELWKSDGNSAGTMKVKHIGPPEFGNLLSNLTVVGDTLYFIVDDGIHGHELWKTDGTEAGTAMVRDIQPPSIWYDSYHSLTAYAGKLYFTVDDGIIGSEPWVSDGTEAGTMPLADVHPGVEGSNAGEFVAGDGMLYFMTYDGTSGSPLWKTDGTTTVRVNCSPQCPSAMMFPTYLNGYLYFSGMDAASGDEIWRINGTNGHVERLDEIVPGRGGSAPSDFFAVGNKLYFSAVTDETNRELFVVDTE